MGLPGFPPIPGQSGHHAVHFYTDRHHLCLSVADFLCDGLAAGQPLVVIATPEHRRQVLQELKQRRFDVHTLVGAQVYLLDARETLDQFMAGGLPQPREFRSTVGTFVATVAHSRPGCVIRAYGEMVDLLWQDGLCEAAIRLEMLWNALARDYGFSLLCGYSLAHFEGQPAAITEVCAQHTHSDFPLTLESAAMR